MKHDKVQEYIWWYLLSNDAAVEKVILELYRQQTNDERGHHITCHRNRRGFSIAHARLGSFFAEKLMSGSHLAGIQLDQARRIAMHYVKQASGLLDNIDIGLPPAILKEVKRDSYANNSAKANPS